MAYFKCPLHTDYELQFIKISNFNEIEAHSLFYCAACLGQFRNQESRNFLSIQRVIQSGSDQILQKWPILNDNSILEELGSILNSLGGEKDLIDGLNQFFDSFLISVQEKISSRKAFFMSKLEQAFKDKKQLTKKYNQISKIEVLKSILLSEPIDLSTKENQLKELISILNSEKNQNTEVLSSFVESMNFFKQIGNQHLKNAQNQIFESLDFFGNIIYANQRQESLILVDSINIQTVVKPSISFDSSLDELDKILDVSIINSNCQSNILELESLYLQNKINDLIQNSQSNFVVDSYQQQKERQKNINQIEQVGKYKSFKIFQIQSFNQQNRPTFLDDQNQPNLEQQDLNVSYVSCISSLNQILQYLVKNKLIEDKNIQINSLDQKDLLKVINFASHLQHQYNQESYSRNVKNSNHVRVLNEIISEKLSNIFVENQVEDYLIETFPFLINNLDLKLLNAYKQDTCQLKYNLMPLIVFKQSTMNRKLNPLYIKKLSNGIICIKATQKKYYTQCFSDVLSTNAKLIFRFKIECSSNLKNFSIGLVYDKMVSNKALICDLDCQMLFYDNNLHVAGGAISSYRNNQNTLINCKNSLLEVRVDLKNKQLEVTDFPNYKNKFSLHEQFKKQINDKQLRLFIYLSSPSFAIELREFFAVNKY